jgi:MFS family permease
VISPEPSDRWRILAILGVGELLAMSPWLCASAVAPLLIADWGLDGMDVPLLTVAVQLGFVVGALLLAATAAADVIPGRRLFLVGALLAAGANLGFAYIATALPSALAFRFLTGFALAGVYPVGMRLVTGWFRLERGLAIGVLVGALTLGSALPYLLRAVGAISGLDWRAVVAGASVAGAIGGPWQRWPSAGRVRWRSDSCSARHPP